MQTKIAPSLLAADLGHLAEELARAEEGGCDAFHVDIMDFHFVPNLSFGPSLVQTVRRLTRLPLDVHLMVDNPLKMLRPFADAGSDSITIHVETVDDVPAALGAIGDLGVRNGLSLRPDTPVEAVTRYIDILDIVLVMSVYPGFGGQHFMEESYDRIRRIAETVEERSLSTEIAVDGGVDLTNAPLLAQAGANSLIAGTSLFHDRKTGRNIRRMQEAIRKMEYDARHG